LRLPPDVPPFGAREFVLRIPGSATTTKSHNHAIEKAAELSGQFAQTHNSVPRQRNSLKCAVVISTKK
jgi:hypothetical protein